MAGGGVVAGKSSRAELYKGRTTAYVVLACIVAASGGLIFGYDIGISGGVTSMDQFLSKFFPAVKRNKDTNSSKDKDYCKYDNQALTAFTSSLYLAGLVASFAASHVTKNYGRRPSIILGGLSFLIGAVLTGAAQNLTMLILGRIMLGVGVGFGNQAVPLYLSEMAPAKLRGALNIMFQLAITIGILCANLINYGAAKIPGTYGWRLSLSLAGVPAGLMTVGGFFLPETPNSLIERGYFEAGRRLLTKVRGTEEVDAEYEDIKEASELASTIKSPFRNILQRRSRPQLVMAIMLPLFQQFTGINAIMFYAPVLFQTIGFGNDASLYSAVITGAVNVLATLVSIATVDRWGRRKLFLEAGFQMFFSQVVIAVILATSFGGEKQLSKGLAVALVIVICVYVSSFAWSWGPLGWLVPSEVFPLETRSAGQAITVSVNLLFTFIIAQAFLAMLCNFKYGIFLFFAGWVVAMTLFVFFFVPETKNVPIEEMMKVWRKHWFWKRIVPTDIDAEALPYKKPNKISNRDNVEMMMNGGVRQQHRAEGY